MPKVPTKVQTKLLTNLSAAKEALPGDKNVKGSASFMSCYITMDAHGFAMFTISSSV